MNLSDYMGGRCLWKFNSMGGWVKNKVPSSPSRYFFSEIALRNFDPFQKDAYKTAQLGIASYLDKESSYLDKELCILAIVRKCSSSVALLPLELCK